MDSVRQTQFDNKIHLIDNPLFFFFHNAQICRTDNLTHSDYLLDTMRAPSYNTCDGKQRRK